MKNVVTTIKTRARAAARWYLESWSHMDPAAAMGMFGTGMVAIPLTAAAEANGR